MDGSNSGWQQQHMQQQCMQQQHMQQGTCSRALTSSPWSNRCALRTISSISVSPICRSLFRSAQPTNHQLASTAASRDLLRTPCVCTNCVSTEHQYPNTREARCSCSADNSSPTSCSWLHSATPLPVPLPPLVHIRAAGSLFGAVFFGLAFPACCAVMERLSWATIGGSAVEHTG